MQKNKLLPLVFLFLILAGVTVWYLFFTPDPQMVALAEERNFAVPETQAISKIFLARRDGETITLERVGDHWVYNGKWKARPTAIENLLDAVGRIQIKYKPAEAAVPNMIRDLAVEGIKVEVYQRSDAPVRTYYVGGSTPDERGTFVIREGYEQPYVAHIPGWEGNLRFRYNLQGDDWRDRAVFEEDPDKIVRVRVEYPKQRSLSFELEKQSEGYIVRPFYPSTPRINAPLRAGSVEAFLVGFERLVAEGFEQNFPRQDSIKQLLPFAVISVLNTSGAERQVKFYPIQPRIVAPDPKAGQLPGSSAIERYFAATSDGDFMLVQNRVFKKIFWGYPFFFEEMQ